MSKIELNVFQQSAVYDNILNAQEKTHCECCGKKRESLRFINEGPYNFVCERCYNLDFTWFEGKQIKKSKYGIASRIKISLNELPNTKLKILLIEPDYYSRFPPLGLLKLGRYHLDRGDTVKLLRVSHERKLIKNKTRKGSKYTAPFKPDIVYVTSLFTWSWKPVWDVIRHYRRYYPTATIYLGGIYASILPDHAAYSGAHYIHEGLIDEIEDLRPAYELVPEWTSSLFFATRGCVRRCTFCVVPKLEGRVKDEKDNIWNQLVPTHKKAILWDNNILGADNFESVILSLKSWGREVDFNQGIDARLITRENARLLKSLKIKILHLAYDTKSARSGVKRGIEYLKEAGFRGKSLIFYTLYNYRDTPEDFLERLKDLMNWGVVSYPMRFEPLTSLKKNQYVSENWNIEILEMIAKARRVLGFMGAFPPYEGLVKKITTAKNLYEAMKLRPTK